MEKSLKKMKVNQIGEVCNFQGSLELNQRLFSMGLMIGKKIKIMDKSRDYLLLQVGKSQMALSIDMIEGVKVRICR